MKITYLSYFGLRTENLERSLEFYTAIFGLYVVSEGDNSKIGGGKFVLLRDIESGQKIELNWYPPGSLFGSQFSSGDSLDHISFKVDNVDMKLRELSSKGISKIELPANLEVHYTNVNSSFKVAYLKDPDGNWIEIYENEAPASSGVTDSY